MDLGRLPAAVEHRSCEYPAEQYAGDLDPPPGEAEAQSYPVERERPFAQLFPETAS